MSINELLSKIRTIESDFEWSEEKFNKIVEDCKIIDSEFSLTEQEYLTEYYDELLFERLLPQIKELVDK